MSSKSTPKSYSRFSKPQYDIGCSFIERLDIRKGQKVLDMGCGTGEITKFIADQVGPDGQVIGVDPDKGRIQLAQQSFQKIPGLSFEIGDSVAGFSHDDEEYYDVHFSTNSFHWQKRENMPCYVEKAYKCLKPGGIIAILTALPSPLFPIPEIFVNTVCLLEEHELTDLVRAGKFNDVQSKIFDSVAYFGSNEEFLSWFKATMHDDFEEMAEDAVRDFRSQFMSTEPDGKIKVHFKNAIQITGKK